MKKRIVSWLLPIGLLMEFIYIIVNRFVVVIPDVIAYPMMVISIAFMVIGLAYNGWCIGKKKNPYQKDEK